MNPKLKVVKKMRALLARPYGWVKHASERDDPQHKIVAYCLMGSIAPAIKAVDPDEFHPLYGQIDDLLNEESYKRNHVGVVAFNDRARTRKKDVLAFLDKVIERLKYESTH